MINETAWINIRNALVLQNMDLCQKIVNRYNHVPREDALQDCYEILIRVAEKYLVSKTTEPFRDFAIPWLRKYIRKSIRKYNSGFTDTLKGINLPEEEPDFSEAQYSAVLKKARQILTREEYDLITLTIKTKDLSKFNGYTIRNAVLIEERGKQKLKTIKKEILDL